MIGPQEVVLGVGFFTTGFFSGVRFKTYQLARRAKKGRNRG